MRTFFNWVIGVPLAILVIGFAVANRRFIDVSLDPFTQADPYASVTMPLWALLFCGVFLGILAGYVACWLAQGKWRRATREALAELHRAQEDLARLRREADLKADAPPATPEPY